MKLISFSSVLILIISFFAHSSGWGPDLEIRYSDITPKKIPAGSCYEKLEESPHVQSIIRTVYIKDDLQLIYDTYGKFLHLGHANTHRKFAHAIRRANEDGRLCPENWTSETSLDRFTRNRILRAFYRLVAKN